MVFCCDIRVVFVLSNAGFVLWLSKVFAVKFRRLLLQKTAKGFHIL